METPLSVMELYDSSKLSISTWPFSPHTNGDMSFTGSTNALKVVILLCPIAPKMVCFTTPQKGKHEIYIPSKSEI